MFVILGIIVLFAAIMMLATALVFRSVFSPIFNVLMGVMLLLEFAAGVFLISLAFRVRMVLTPGEVAFHDGMVTMKTAWANVESVTTMKNTPVSLAVPFLVLREPLFAQTAWWKGPFVWGAAAKLRGRLIPLGRTWARQNELMDDIHRYAPQTVEK
jgi:hypothetical protein